MTHSSNGKYYMRDAHSRSACAGRNHTEPPGLEISRLPVREAARGGDLRQDGGAHLQPLGTDRASIAWRRLGESGGGGDWVAGVEEVGAPASRACRRRGESGAEGTGWLASEKCGRRLSGLPEAWLIGGGGD
jgi:hypothetical protein